MILNVLHELLIHIIVIFSLISVRRSHNEMHFLLQFPVKLDSFYYFWPILMLARSSCGFKMIAVNFQSSLVDVHEKFRNSPP